jgi:hypothetical protein
MGRSAAGGEVYLMPEEALYMVGRGSALLYLDLNDPTITDPLNNRQVLSLQEAYQLLLGNQIGVPEYHIYSHLKNLGYILARSDCGFSRLPDDDEVDANNVTNELTEQLSAQLTLSSGKLNSKRLLPKYYVWKPKRSFKKTAPGPPDFLLSIVSGGVNGGELMSALSMNWFPSLGEFQALRTFCSERGEELKGVPVKIGLFDRGVVSFFSLSVH